MKNDEIGEEARLVRIVGHVADRIEMNQRRDRRHHHQHHGGKRIDAQGPIDLEVPRGDEVEQRDAGVVPVKADVDEGKAGEHPGQHQQRGGDELGGLRAGGRSGDLFFAFEARVRPIARRIGTRARVSGAAQRDGIGAAGCRRDGGSPRRPA